MIASVIAGIISSVAIILAIINPAVFFSIQSGNFADAIQYPDVAKSIHEQCDFRVKSSSFSENYSDCANRMWDMYHIHTLRDRN